MKSVPLQQIKGSVPMGEKWGWPRWAFAVFFGIMLLHVAAIALFTRGFLLTRTELPLYSQCSDVSQSPCFPPSVSGQQTQNDLVDRSQNRTFAPPVRGGQGCWTEPVVDRVIIIILDALRFDFLAPSSFFEEEKPWMDKLQVLQKLASKPGSFAKIFKAIADPPTTSVQRLKGLTTGGLPTFIDVGNSFGAPAIIEDNLLYQLAQNGKRVVMMGDDTWVQLFPNHFNASYPFPSFNVKDLHTVDNGCIEHLFPWLYREDWDVLIAHFLGVDHAGHIHGVDSSQMEEKLEQYNGMLEKVVKILESLSSPGGLHENTLLLVMGDHGQTINGDHGGGSPEEVETALFALSLKNASSSPPCESDQLEMEAMGVPISSFYQLDFVATVSALLGLPFPFGSIGRVDPELYELVAASRELRFIAMNEQNEVFEVWMEKYVNVLCINSWQVRRYIDAYFASSAIGFSGKDLEYISDLYAKAQELWSKNVKYRGENKSPFFSSSALKMQIDAYSDFLSTVAGLARSKWTEFNLRLMSFGFCLMVVSIFVHFYLIKKLDKQFQLHVHFSAGSGISFTVVFACGVVLIRAFSFLSNSFILEEGKVASFLLASTGMLQLRHALAQKSLILEGLVFVLLIPMLRFGIELGQAKQAVNSLFLKYQSSWMLGILKDSVVLVDILGILPLLSLVLLACMLYRCMSCSAFKGVAKYVVTGTIFNYALITLIWAIDSSLLHLPMAMVGAVRGHLIPRTVYAVNALQLLLLAVMKPCSGDVTTRQDESVTVRALAMLSSCSSTVILLSGKQGPLVALSSIIAGWCIIRFLRLKQSDSSCVGISSFYSFPIAQWSLLATSLFFCTGHWCAFDGLRYAAAFIGFDEFNLVRQAFLLTLDTFGFSHILPILGLPVLVACLHPNEKNKQKEDSFSIQICQVYLMYGLIIAVPATLTILCVAIQRRHLMVWGLFAPKFVFDVVGLILSDFLICLASLYYLA